MPTGVRSHQKALKEEFVLLSWKRVKESCELTRAAESGKRVVVGLETSPGDAAVTAKQDGQLVPR